MHYSASSIHLPLCHSYTSLTLHQLFNYLFLVDETFSANACSNFPTKQLTSSKSTPCKGSTEIGLCLTKRFGYSLAKLTYWRFNDINLNLYLVERFGCGIIEPIVCSPKRFTLGYDKPTLCLVKRFGEGPVK